MPDVKSGLGLAGSIIGGKKSSDGQRAAAEAAQYKPYNISGGFGSGTFKGQSGTATLGDPWSGIRDYYLDQMGFFNNQLGQFKPPNRADYNTYANYTPTKTLADFQKELGGSAGTGEFLFYDPTTGYGIKSNRELSDVERAHIDAAEAERTAADPYGSQFDLEKTDDIKKFYSGLINGFEEGDRPEVLLGLTDIRNAISADYYKNGPSAGGANADAQAAYEAYLAGAGEQFDEEGYNAAVAAYKSPEERIYDRLSLLSAEDEQLERNTLENRLFSQGMLGSKGGYQRSRALQTAQANKALQRENYAVTLAEEIQNQIQRRGINSLNAGIGLEQLPLDYLKLGSSVGIANAQAGSNAAQYLANAGNNQGDAISGFFSSLGSTFGSQPSSGVFSTPTFNPGYGSGSYSTPDYYSPDGGGYGLGTGIFG